MNETRRAILEAIAEEPIGGPTLADELSVSRAAVWKHVEALREDGFAIESGPDGYRLTDVPEYGAAAIECGLEAPFSVEYHDSIESTNDRARQLAAAGREDVVVVADEQTGGRGRLEREWAAPSGGVWLSAVCRPDIPPAKAPLYTLAAAVSTARAIREAGVDAGIKWPNDVVIPVDGGDSSEDGDWSGDGEASGSEGPGRGYRKLAGVLTEMEGETDRVDWLVVGVGVNANVDASGLPAGATSVRDERLRVGYDQDPDVNRRRFVQRLVEEFDRYRGDLESVVPDWTDLALTVGQRVRVDRPNGAVRGKAVDVTPSGALVIDTGDGRVTVTTGDCEHLRPAEGSERDVR